MSLRPGCCRLRPARLGIMTAAAVVALLLAIGIVTAGMVVPSLFDRIAPEWTR